MRMTAADERVEAECDSLVLPLVLAKNWLALESPGAGCRCLESTEEVSKNRRFSCLLEALYYGSLVLIWCHKGKNLLLLNWRWLSQSSYIPCLWLVTKLYRFTFKLGQVLSTGTCRAGGRKLHTYLATSTDQSFWIPIHRYVGFRVLPPTIHCSHHFFLSSKWQESHRFKAGCTILVQSLTAPQLRIQTQPYILQKSQTGKTASPWKSNCKRWFSFQHQKLKYHFAAFWLLF